MKHAITIDFGSTFTKVVVSDLENKKIMLSDKVPSTVGTDASISLNQCLDLAKTALNEEEFEAAAKLASSSAAGGLRMAVIGLTASLSALAGKSAALGAGAKIIAAYHGRLTEENLRELEKSKAEIILLCGGYEKGNVSMVLENALTLAESKVRVPIIYAGNSGLDREVRTMMKANHKQCFITENMIPRLGELNVEPTQEIIRNLFLERITDMKGLNQVKQVFHNQMIPTPLAVLQAGELLNRGTATREGAGPVLIVDIGGATTDVYSFNENESFEGAKMVGLAEPFAKRTVEGDLGMRESSGGVLSDQWLPVAAEQLGVSQEELRDSIRKRMESIDYLPDSETELAVDDMIGKIAVYQAVRRHGGRVTASFNKNCQNIQCGKNLTDIEKIIGTGGILVHNRRPAEILKAAERTEKDSGLLIPQKLETWLDTDYVLFAAGLIREIDEDAALAIMLDSIKNC